MHYIVILNICTCCFPVYVFSIKYWELSRTLSLWAWAAIVNFRDVDDTVDRHQALRWWATCGTPPGLLGDRTSADSPASPPSRNGRQVSRDSPVASHVDMCCIVVHVVHIWTSAYLCPFLVSLFMVIDKLWLLLVWKAWLYWKRLLNCNHAYTRGTS